MDLLRNFYHPDHTSTMLNTSIGSSSVSTRLNYHWITDGSGNAIQHLHYLPFGEDWVDQRNTSWNAPYTFSGKEKDVETGYGYFGARYYDSGLSIWLSVDPMSDKYPSMSPYNYCANNPVILADPDGRDPGDPPTGKFVSGFGNYCYTYSGGRMTSSQVDSYNAVTPKLNSPITKAAQWINNSRDYTYQNRKQPVENNKRGGVELTKKTNDNTYGADQKTKQDVNLVDVTNFPTGDGGGPVETLGDMIQYSVGLVERGEMLFNALQAAKKEYQNQKSDSEYQQEIINVTVYSEKDGRGMTTGTNCARKDSAEKVKELQEQNK